MSSLLLKDWLLKGSRWQQQEELAALKEKIARMKRAFAALNLLSLDLKQKAEEI